MYLLTPCPSYSPDYSSFHGEPWRSVPDMVAGCLWTMAVVALVTVHPNVSASRQEDAMVAAERSPTYSMHAVGLLSPEVMLVCAIKQCLGALVIRRDDK